MHPSPLFTGTTLATQATQQNNHHNNPQLDTFPSPLDIRNATPTHTTKDRKPHNGGRRPANTAPEHLLAIAGVP